MAVCGGGRYYISSRYCCGTVFVVCQIMCRSAVSERTVKICQNRGFRGGGYSTPPLLSPRQGALRHFIHHFRSYYCCALLFSSRSAGVGRHLLVLLNYDERITRVVVVVACAAGRFIRGQVFSHFALGPELNIIFPAAKK